MYVVGTEVRRACGRLPVLALIAGLCALALGGARPGAPLHADDAPQPPITDPVQLVSAYYQAFAAAVNRGDFSALPAYFTPDAAIDSGLAPGSISGTAQILAFFQSLPPMQSFTVETSDILEDDPYVDVDWRFRAAPTSLRGYLDGHDTFTIANGLISSIEQQVDPQAAADAFMPPPDAPVPSGPATATTEVEIANYVYTPQVIRVPAGATVTWTNDDADDHAVTTDDLSLDTGIIEQGVSVTLTFPTAGQYLYYCTVHPGMRGEVIVGGQ